MVKARYYIMSGDNLIPVYKKDPGYFIVATNMTIDLSKGISVLDAETEESEPFYETIKTVDVIEFLMDLLP